MFSCIVLLTYELLPIQIQIVREEVDEIVFLLVVVSRWGEWCGSVSFFFCLLFFCRIRRSRSSIVVLVVAILPFLLSLRFVGFTFMFLCVVIVS